MQQLTSLINQLEKVVEENKKDEVNNTVDTTNQNTID